MPLSKPKVAREEVYFRHIDYVGYRREDEFWDIEGHFRDLRPFDFPCVDRGGLVPAGETFHEMFLRLTIDDDMVIHGLEVRIDNFPYKQCPCAAEIFKSVVGMKIGDGFSKEVRRRIPAKLGCTHLFGLLIGAAGAAFQTVSQIRMMKYCRGLKPDPLDTCLAWDSSGEMVKRQWPDFYREKEDGSST